MEVKEEQHETSTAQHIGDADPSHLHSRRLFIVTTSLCLGAVLYGLDMNIVSVAVPVITTRFHSLVDIAWYSAAYSLTITAFQPFFGNVYKYFPAKVVFAGSILLFEIGSIICATANSSAVLIFGRAFLGFGAAGLLQGALGIVSCIVRLEKIPMYQGFVAGAAAVSATAGPVIGGGLTDHVSWRWCFWMPEDTATGNAIAIFSWQLGGAIAVSIGQNLLLNNLKTSIPAHTSELSVQQVINAGAGGLKMVAPDMAVLQDLREAYAEALRGTFVLALVGTCLALPFAAGMQWLNIKKIAEKRIEKPEKEKRGLVGGRRRDEVEGVP